MGAVKCTHHCRRCGRHFHSLAAFDDHLERETPDGPMIGCYSPDHSTDVLGDYVGFQGTCDISGAEVLEGTVWEKTSRRGNVRTAKA
jgi:hypothetical protein